MSNAEGQRKIASVIANLKAVAERSVRVIMSEVNS